MSARQKDLVEASFKVLAKFASIVGVLYAAFSFV
jgi:hypothetical protein